MPSKTVFIFNIREYILFLIVIIEHLLQKQHNLNPKLTDINKNLMVHAKKKTDRC